MALGIRNLQHENVIFIRIQDKNFLDSPSTEKFKCGQYKYFTGNCFLKVRVSLHVAWSYSQANAVYT